MGCREFSKTSLVIPLLRTSSAEQNSKGDKGSPCLTPIVQEKKPSRFALTLMESFAE